MIHFSSARYLVKNLIRSGVKSTYREIVNDIRKDRIPLSPSDSQIVWIAGLPKSGTTLIENILDQTPYIQGDKSFFRQFDTRDLVHEHAISERMFKAFPQRKRTFLKTHTHYHSRFVDIAQKYNARIMISIRDIRSVMLSRYHHVISDSRHWQHNAIKDLEFTDGLYASLVEDCGTSRRPIDYYSTWIKGWLTYSRNAEVLLLRYEDYTNNPLGYIGSILEDVKAKNISARTVEERINAIRSNAIRTESLAYRRRKFGRRSSTFRRGIGAKAELGNTQWIAFRKKIEESLESDNSSIFYD